jgi:hypothetical protein
MNCIRPVDFSQKHNKGVYRCYASRLSAYPSRLGALQIAQLPQGRANELHTPLRTMALRTEASSKCDRRLAANVEACGKESAAARTETGAGPNDTHGHRLTREQDAGKGLRRHTSGRVEAEV